MTCTTTSSFSYSKIIISLVSIGVGIGAFFKTQAILKPTWDPVVVEACTVPTYIGMEDFVAKGYQPFDRRVGFFNFNGFVCYITQFLYDLVHHQYPAGLITWGATALGFPAFITLHLEAGRQGNGGFLDQPSLLWLLSQMVGISVIWPTMFVPFYCIRGNPTGSVSVIRARTVFFISLGVPILTVLVFCILPPNDSPQWTFCAGALGGPMVCSAGILLYAGGAPKTVTTKDAIRSAETSALAYAAAGILSLLGYFYIVYVALLHYTSPSDLLDDTWFEAAPSVRFMAVDAVGLWVGLLLHVGSRSLRRMMEAIACTPFFGPGAAYAMAMASLEMDSAPQLTSNNQGKKQP